MQINIERLRLKKEIVNEIVSRILEGGAGSGNWGHKGRPGYRGGSAPGGGYKKLFLKTAMKNIAMRSFQMMPNEYRKEVKEIWDSTISDFAKQKPASIDRFEKNNEDIAVRVAAAKKLRSDIFGEYGVYAFNKHLNEKEASAPIAGQIAGITYAKKDSPVYKHIVDVHSYVTRLGYKGMVPDDIYFSVDRRLRRDFGAVTFQNVIGVARDTTSESIAHELGHVAEERNTKMSKASQAFLKSRDDRFCDPYVGTFYPFKSSWGNPGTEVFSMGLQYLTPSKKVPEEISFKTAREKKVGSWFASKDTEHFLLTLAMLKGKI